MFDMLSTIRKDDLGNTYIEYCCSRCDFVIFIHTLHKTLIDDKSQDQLCNSYGFSELIDDVLIYDTILTY